MSGTNQQLTAGKHAKNSVLTESKLNVIQYYIGKAFTGGNVGDDEFALNLGELDEY